MKLFRSEVAHNYDSYTFAYAEYAKREKGDSLANLYDAGYLPYSGSTEATDIFYMARSSRIDVRRFELTSENRRIAKKFDGAFEKERVPFKEFKLTEEFSTFCLDYFSKRHGQNTMPQERLEFILNSGLISAIVVYTKDRIPVAYVFEVGEKPSAHYWYSFYDLSLTNQSLGMWLMLDAIRDAKKSGLFYYYLGTVYGEKALYKTNFDSLEWWDGKSWNTDISRLRELSRRDEEREIEHADLFKKGLSTFT